MRIGTTLVVPNHITRLVYSACNMSASFEGAVTWAHRRRGLVFAGVAVLLALSFLGLRQISFDANVLRLLPARGAAVPAFRTFLDRFGTLDDLYVVFTAPDGHAINDYEEQIARWVEALRELPELTRVESGLPEHGEGWRWLLDRELLLLNEPRLDEALTRLRPDQAQMTAVLQQTRELLAVPSPEIVAMVRDDPFRFHELLRDQLAGAQGSASGVSDAGLVSPDGRRRLIVARPSQSPYDTEFSHRLMERLERLRHEIADTPGDGDEPLPPVDVAFAGGHRIAIEAEDVVKRESIVNGAGSLALILPMLFLVFRSAWLVVIGALPSAVALLVVLGVMGLTGVTLSAAATGASAMLFGLGVDGVVLLYVAHHHALAEGHEPKTAIRALGGPAASMLLGMWTTAATFLGLLVVDFPSLEQLGLLIGLSMIVCGVLTLLLVPASLSSRPPRRLPRSLALPQLAVFIKHHRRTVLAGAVLATVVLGYFASTLRVNFSLDRLRSVTAGARMVDDITRVFGLPGDAILVLARGADLDALLHANERLTAALVDHAPDVQFQPASALLPSQATQQARLAKIRPHVTNVDAVLASLEGAAAEVGFKPQTFGTFAGRLPHLGAADQRITFEGYIGNGLGDVIGRFVRKDNDEWLVASYAFPTSPAGIAAIQNAVQSTADAGIATGLPIVNAELSQSFMPQFLVGLAVGTAVVLLSIVVTFRDLRLSLLTLLPTALGLTWAAGVLGVAGAELDLFSVFAVITFVGIGVDYGIHMVHRYQERGDAAAAVSELAPVILVAGAITLFGYGTLITSSYPPLRSIGVVSAVSVAALVLASVLVLPALLQRTHTSREDVREH